MRLLTPILHKVACWLFWLGLLFSSDLYARQNIINDGNMEATTLTWIINHNVTTTDYTYLSAPYTGSTVPGQSTVYAIPIDTGCFGPASLLKNSFSPCDIPVASITQQPTCTVPTGTITVSTPLGTEFEYSLDGTTFQASPVFNNLSSSTYTVTLRNNLMGCMGTGNTLTFSTAGLQQPDITAVQTVVDCEVVLTTSSTTPNTSLVWNGPTLAPNSANPATTLLSGTYTATATNLLTGCTQDFNVVVLHLDIPSSPAVVTVLPTCTTASGSIRIATPVDPSYLYSIDGTTYQTAIDFLNLPPAVYPVTVKNSITGCISTPFMADLSLPILPQPPVALFPVISLCQNATDVEWGVNPMAGATLKWYGQNATGGTPSSTAPIVDTSVLGTFTYYCSQSIGFCESARIAISLMVYVGSVAPDFDDIEICQGGVVPLLPAVSPNGIPGTWSPSVVSTTANGTYTFTPSATACASMQTITATIVAPAILSFDWFVDTDFSDNQTVTVVPAGVGNYLYQLDGGTPQSSPVFHHVAAGLHSITMMDADGCSKAVTKNDVLVVGYPHFFTPNNDSYNDTWSIKALFYQHDAKVDIFDRYGKLLKRLNLKNAEVWDGTYNGQLLPATDYWFTLHYNNLGVQQQFNSHFSLKR